MKTSSSTAWAHDVQRSTILVVALAASLVLYLLSRTQRGQSAAVDAVGFVSMTAQRAADAILPRGIRNKNPGNLEYLPASRAWRGQVGRDGRFGVYQSAALGVRALAQQLLKYARSGKDSVREIITTWAPAHENQTEAYVRAVARALNVGPSDRIDVRARLPELAVAIIKHENGWNPYSADEVRQWVYS